MTGTNSSLLTPCRFECVQNQARRNPRPVSVEMLSSARPKDDSESLEDKLASMRNKAAQRQQQQHDQEQLQPQQMHHQPLQAPRRPADSPITSQAAKQELPPPPSAAATPVPPADLGVRAEDAPTSDQGGGNKTVRTLSMAEQLDSKLETMRRKKEMGMVETPENSDEEAEEDPWVGPHASPSTQESRGISSHLYKKTQD